MRKLAGITLLLIGLCAATAWYSPNFLDTVNLQNLSRQIAMLAVLAIGEGIVILAGGIDLSVGSIIAFSGMIFVFAGTRWGLGPVESCLIVAVISILIGVWHGLLVSRLNLQPFIVTLCSMLALRGLARRMGEDQAVGFGVNLPGFRFLGNGEIAGIPTPVIVLVVVACVCIFFIHYTKYGRYLYAIGRNEKAVAYSGISVPRMKIVSYAICALLSGVSGILFAGYTNSVQPASTGQAYELYAIAAAVLGGCSLRAGEGTIVGIIIGASILKTITNGINLVGISVLWEYTVIGVVILAGVIADAMYKLRAPRAEKYAASHQPEKRPPPEIS